MARKPKHTAYSLENGRSYAELRTFTRTVTAQGSLTDAEENPNAIALEEHFCSKGQPSGLTATAWPGPNDSENRPSATRTPRVVLVSGLFSNVIETSPSGLQSFGT